MEPAVGTSTTSTSTSTTATTATSLETGAASTAGETGTTDTTTAEPTTDTSGASTTSADRCPEIFDDFADGTIDAIWNQVGQGALLEADGELQFTVTPEVDAYPTIFSVPSLNFANDGYLRARLERTSEVEGVEMMLRFVEAGAGDSNEYQLVVVPAAVCARYEPGGGPFTDLQCAPFDLRADRWIQIRVDTGVIYFESSADGATFASFFATATPEIPLNAIEVGFQAGNLVELDDDDDDGGVELTVSISEIEACGDPR